MSSGPPRRLGAARGTDAPDLDYPSGCSSASHTSRAPAPFISDATDHSMVPNQGMVTAPAETEIGPGDWVFYHPRQSDALFQFEQLRMVRGGRLEGETMAAYPRRY